MTPAPGLTYFRLKPATAGDWEYYVLPVSDFPAPEDEIAPLRRFMIKLCSSLEEQFEVRPEIFFQYTQLELGDAAARLSAHGREWMPKVGLGVWPDRPAPCMYKPEDITSLGIGERPRRIMYQLFQVTTGLEARHQALEVMLGTGATLQMMSREPADVMIEHGRRCFLTNITDPSYTAFEYYLPLLEARTIASASGSGEITDWCCGAMFYIRESPEDKGILIASATPLAPVLERLGGRLISGAEPEWHFRASI